MNLNLNPSAIIAPLQLETERLLLKPVVEEFRPFVFIGLADPDVRNAMKMPVVDTPRKQQEWWKKHTGWWATGKAVQWCAFDKNSGKYVALLTLKEIDPAHYRGEIGYSVMKEEWGKGIGREAVSRVVGYAFEEIGLHSLFAMILPYNIPSQKIVKGLGFRQEASFKDLHFYQGSFYEVWQFYKINPDHLC